MEQFAQLLGGLDVSCELVAPDGRTLAVGEQPPAFRVVFKNQRAWTTPLNELALGRAYVEGDIDLEGDMMGLFDIRRSLGDDSRHPRFIKTFPKAGYRFVGPVEEFYREQPTVIEIEEITAVQIEYEKETAGRSGVRKDTELPGVGDAAARRDERVRRDVVVGRVRDERLWSLRAP